jgi:RNase H-fold protein (predicted Holliday junction resolvase)
VKAKANVEKLRIGNREHRHPNEVSGSIRENIENLQKFDHRPERFERLLQMLDELDSSIVVLALKTSLELRPSRAQQARELAGILKR